MTFHQRTVLIYGDSVFLEGIAACLRTRGDLTVTTIQPPADAAALAALHPDLILVDASQVTANQTEALIAAFPKHPSPPIIRLNLDSQQLTVISAQQFPAASLDDLAQVIEIISKPK